jgi:hypothetical protein
MLIKALLAWMVIAAAETVHGILRVKLLNPRFGDRRARRFSVFSGTAIILLIGWFAVPWIGPSTPEECLLVGSLWLGLMVVFDVGIGRLYFRLSWSRIAADFDVRQGGLLGFGMAALFFTPLAVVKLRGLF